MAVKKSGKKTYCKEPGCFEDVQVKGYCRLHFLKAAKAKQLEHKDEFEDFRAAAKDRRRGNRLTAVEAGGTVENEDLLSRESERMAELDLDVEEYELVETTNGNQKTGTDDLGDEE